MRAALGAGLGRAEAEPIFRVDTVPSELKPVPVTVTVSSTDASAGVSTIVGDGTLNPVLLPEIVPTVAFTIVAPGESDPPAAAAGTSAATLNVPEASVVNPPDGSPLESPKFRTDPVVDGGKPEPVTVTV